MSASSSIPSAFSFSTVSSSRASRPEQRGYLSNSDVADTSQAQQEEQTSTKYLLSSNSFDERQLQQSQEKKAKGSLSLPPSSSSPSTTSSSSVFSFPPLHKPPPLSDNEHTSLPFVKEQNKFHHLPHREQEYSDWQPLNQNNQLLLEEKLEQEEEEEEDGSGGGEEELRVRKHQPSSIPALFIRPPNFDLSDVPEENNSFSSSYSFSDTPGENNTNGNRYPLLTSTPTLPSFPTTHRTTSDKPFSSFLSVNNNNNNIKSLPLTFDSRADRSSTISTVGLIADLQRKADACELNNMSSSLSSSSLRYSSNLGASTWTSQPYDQRISDQGDKYIIQLKTDEYQENEFTITPRYSSHQLVIDAKYREEDSAGGYVHRELHKIFNIPQHIDLARHTHSYNKQTQELTIEMPYLQASSSASSTNPSRISPIRNPAELSTFSYGNRSRASVDSTHTSGLGTTATDSTLMRSSNPAAAPLFDTSLTTSKPFDFDLFHRSAFRPQIVRAASNHDPGEKKLVMSLDLSDYQAEDIKVSIKDRELIVQAERKIETDTRKSRTSFYQSTSLPPQTDIEHLQSNYIDGKLVIEAPYLEQTHPDQRVQSITTSHSNQAGAKKW